MEQQMHIAQSKDTSGFAVRDKIPRTPYVGESPNQKK
jgi:hypothetical protein